MKIELVNAAPAQGLVCFFVLQDGKMPSTLSPLLNGVDKKRFEGKAGQTFYAETREQKKLKQILVVGLGKKAEFKLDNLRRAAGTCVRYAASIRSKEFTVDVSYSFGKGRGLVSEAVQAIVEGAVLASYKCTEFKSSKEDIFTVEKMHMIFDQNSNATVKTAIDRGLVFANAQNYSRKLDEKPANILSPEAVAAEARKLAREYDLSCTIFDKSQLVKKCMNGILAVCQ